MYTTIEKRKYLHPEIACITLDKMISLVMESYPPDGPGEGGSQNETDFFEDVYL